jgi:hypothetical protein
MRTKSLDLVDAFHYATHSMVADCIVMYTMAWPRVDRAVAAWAVLEPRTIRVVHAVKQECLESYWLCAHLCPVFICLLLHGLVLGWVSPGTGACGSWYFSRNPVHCTWSRHSPSRSLTNCPTTTYPMKQWADQFNESTNLISLQPNERQISNQPINQPNNNNKVTKWIN